MSSDHAETNRLNLINFVYHRRYSINQSCHSSKFNSDEIKTFSVLSEISRSNETLTLSKIYIEKSQTKVASNRFVDMLDFNAKPEKSIEIQLSRVNIHRRDLWIMQILNNRSLQADETRHAIFTAPSASGVQGIWLNKMSEFA